MRGGLRRAHAKGGPQRTGLPPLLLRTAKGLSTQVKNYLVRANPPFLRAGPWRGGRHQPAPPTSGV